MASWIVITTGTALLCAGIAAGVVKSPTPPSPTLESLPPMRVRPTSLLVPLAAAALLCGLSGCGTINEKLSEGMGDYVPQWAGGLPADVVTRNPREIDGW